MTTTSIIQRRDLEPLWLKANEVVRHYEKAANCISAVVSADCALVEYSRHPKTNVFCDLCKRYHQHASKMSPGESPCRSMHCAATKNARKSGGSYLYSCPVGFYFWSSPFLVGERFAGTFISTVIPLAEREKALDRMFRICRGEISRAEIAGHIDGYPARTEEEIRGLACMSQLCARQISRSKSVGLSTEWAEYDCPSSPDSPEDQERLLLASLRRGDNVEARSITQRILGGANEGNVEQFKLKAIELAAMLSRSGSNAENSRELVEENNRYLMRIKGLTSAEEITSYTCMAVERMSGKIFSFQGLRHASALRKAERFIQKNYTRKISLREIAGASGLSAPYFSTIFKDEMGENLSNYLNRIRVEKACAMLRETDDPVRGISIACGFEDQSWFSKIFKSYTGHSPCKYRKLG
ncbi:MAG: helix-turn-helix domain-containing protein [Treponema sp.]|nr:helix-turn-helix domain-containing protein [Treponema sp.]